MKTFDIGPKGEVEESQFAAVLDAAFEEFSERLRKVVKGIVGDFEVEYLPFLPGDTVANIRSDMVEAVTYDDDKYHLRRKIFEEHREELVNDKIVELEREVEMLREQSRYYT